MKSKFLEVSQATKLTQSIAKNGAKLEKDIQAVAMSAIFHANTPKDNNASIGINLVRACSGAVRKSSLVVYLCTHGNFKYNEKSKEVEFDRKDDVLTDPDQLFAVLSSNSWTKACKEINPAEVLDAGKLVQALVKRIKTAIKDGRKVEWANDVLTQVVKAEIEGAALNVNVTETE